MQYSPEDWWWYCFPQPSVFHKATKHPSRWTWLKIINQSNELVFISWQVFECVHIWLKKVSILWLFFKENNISYTHFGCEFLLSLPGKSSTVNSGNFGCIYISHWFANSHGHEHKNAYFYTLLCKLLYIPDKQEMKDVKVGNIFDFPDQQTYANL